MPFATIPNLSNNLSREESILSEDLPPLTSTPSVRTTPCGLQNIALDGITNISEELLPPSTPIVNSSTQSNLDSIVPGGNSLAMNNPTYHNLDVPQFLSFSDPILCPSSANPSDPRIEEILKNQKIIIGNLNSLTGLVKQLIKQQHISVPTSNDAVGDFVQTTTKVGTSNSVSEDDCRILPSADPEISSTDIAAHTPPASELVSNDELAAIKLKSSGPTAFAGALFRMLFTLDEMKGQNCRGLAKKAKLDEGKLKKIQEYVYKYYPDTPDQLSRTWARCTQTIDSYIRSKKHKDKNF